MTSLTSFRSSETEAVTGTGDHWTANYVQCVVVDIFVMLRNPLQSSAVKLKTHEMSRSSAQTRVLFSFVLLYIFQKYNALALTSLGNSPAVCEKK